MKPAKRRRVRAISRKFSRKGSTYKPTESERRHVPHRRVWRASRSGIPAGTRPILHRQRQRPQGELRWCGMVIGASERHRGQSHADGRGDSGDWLQGYTPKWSWSMVARYEPYGYNQSALKPAARRCAPTTYRPRAVAAWSEADPRLFRNSPAGQAVNHSRGWEDKFASVSSCSILTPHFAGVCTHPVFAGRLAIVIDDFGYRPAHGKKNCVLCYRQTFRHCPTRRTRAKWQPAHNSGHEVLIHLPMAPLQTAAGEGYAGDQI